MQPSLALGNTPLHRLVVLLAEAAHVVGEGAGVKWRVVGRLLVEMEDIVGAAVTRGEEREEGAEVCGHDGSLHSMWSMSVSARSCSVRALAL